MRRTILAVAALMVLGFAGNTVAVMAGKVVEYEVKGAGKVVFDGSTHKDFACVDCHPSPFQMKRGSTEIKMDMMQKHKGCGFCHDGKKAFNADDQANCAKCHQRPK